MYSRHLMSMKIPAAMNNITFELITEAIDCLFKTISNIYDTDEVPDDFEEQYLAARTKEENSRQM